MKSKYWDKQTIDKIRKGYYSASYFNKTKEILLKEKNIQKVTMQIFQKNDGAILCGVNQVIELLQIGTGYFKDGKWISKWRTLKVEHLKDGKALKSLKPVIHIKG